MKKILKILIFIVICVILLNGIIYNDEKIMKNSVIIQDTSNALSIMIETTDNSGIYKELVENTWPQEGYLFNDNLSKCENGSNLTWDNATKKVVMKGNVSDKCFIYFDKYIFSKITNLTATNITANSITVNVTSLNGTSKIVKYYYSINNGKYVESINDNYSFINLLPNTLYEINVYAIDEKGFKSNSYSIKLKTTVNLINFSIKNTKFQAEQNMTWEQFIKSEYNTNGSVVLCEPAINTYGNEVCINGQNIYKGGDICRESFSFLGDIIVDNYNYYTAPEKLCNDEILH